MKLRSDVSLVPLMLDHGARMLQWMLDPEVSGGIGLRSTPTLERTLDWIRRAQSDGTTHAFAILRAGEHIGNLVLDRVDTYLQTSRLSIFIGEAAARGRGVGRTALVLGVRRAFTELNLHKIWLTVHAENEAARRSYLQVGFKLEGTLRGEFLLGGRRIDALYMGLLRDEFVELERRAELKETP